MGGEVDGKRAGEVPLEFTTLSTRTVFDGKFPDF